MPSIRIISDNNTHFLIFNLWQSRYRRSPTKYKTNETQLEKQYIIASYYDYNATTMNENSVNLLF